jgi:predicted Zn-dependent protease with MMP-like domain
MDPEAAHAVYHLGLVLERIGPVGEADRAFAKANALDPERYPLPVEVDEPTFRQAAADAFDNLPRSIREYVEDVPLLVEDFPSPELLAEENLSPQILGIYLGVPRTEAGANDQPQDLTRVILYKRNLEKVCRDEDELVEQIQITVRHEIGHHLGLSEEDLEGLGLG